MCLFLLGLIPGMPNTLFLLGSALTFFIWWILKKNNQTSNDNDTNNI